MSRGPPGNDRGGRPGWSDRPNSQEKNQDDKDAKRAGSRWAVTESSSPTVVSDEEDWDDDVNQKPVKLAPLPQTEPIDDDSQEDDFNDFEDEAASVEMNKPVAIVEIADDSSSSSVEEMPNTEAGDAASNGSAGPADGDDEAAATPLYDEPENKDKTAAVQDEPVAEEEGDAEGQNHTDDFDGDSRGDQQDGQEEQRDDVSEDQELHNHSNERSNDVVSNGGDMDETHSDDQSNDGRTSRRDNHENDDGNFGEQEEDEEARCPTPDAHIESGNEETEEPGAEEPHKADDENEGEEEDEDDDEDAIQSD